MHLVGPALLNLCLTRSDAADRAGIQLTTNIDASFALQEGGLYFAAHFALVDAAVTYLEGYLGRPFSHWTLFPRAAIPIDFDELVPQGSFWTALREFAAPANSP